MMTPFSPSVLPAGVRSRFIHDVNGITFHALEAGFETPGRQLVLLLHGFPELAYSWRKVMAPLAAAGYHVIAPDVRGYGRSGGTEIKHSDDMRAFGSLNKINDMLALVSALGYRSVAGVFGHDQGSPLAGWCALTRPDVFKSVILMSSPFRGAPESLPFNTVNVPAPTAPVLRIHEDLARLTPPRKYYMKYYTQPEANDNIWHPKQGLHAFLRAYYHMKSADWVANKPFPLTALIASEWEKLPRYYVMDLDKDMAESVAPEMPSAQEIAACHWLTEAELSVYSEEYGRTGFQGGLQGYRIGGLDQELKIFAGRTIDVPSLFIGGKSDWGVYQTPGGLESVETTLTTQYKGTVLVEGAGHWVQQEQAEKVSKIFIDFLAASLAH
jgi:pimeloyl-ACP methyl ester carboxylesterase